VLMAGYYFKHPGGCFLYVVCRVNFATLCWPRFASCDQDLPVVSARKDGGVTAFVEVVLIIHVFNNRCFNGECASNGDYKGD